MELERDKRDAMTRAHHFAALSDADLKRAAVTIAHIRDPEALWQLTEAHLTLHGESGALISVNTYKTYRRGVYDLIAAWQGENLLRPTRDAGPLWVRTLEARGLAASTIRVKLAAAKALYRALRWSRATDVSPFSDVRPAKDKTNPWEKQQAYSAEAIELLIHQADPVTRVLILLGAHGGLRISEMLKLTWQDVDLHARQLTVVAGKGKKTRTVHLSGRLVKALEAIEAHSSFVLPFRARLSARERLERLCQRSQVKFLGLHALRHAAGTRLQRQTGDLSKVADHLGHASLEMARNYAKADQSALKQALEDW